MNSIRVNTVGGITLTREAPWLNNLYHGPFRELAEQRYATTVACAEDQRIGINLNVQVGADRYEAHVDSNPIEGLLYVTDHPPGTGGELVVSNRPDARGTDDIDRNSSIVYPVAGQLLFFDARNNPHYVRPLQGEASIRITVAMNFYTPYCKESERPPDLNKHLFGES